MVTQTFQHFEPISKRKAPLESQGVATNSFITAAPSVTTTPSLASKRFVQQFKRRAKITTNIAAIKSRPAEPFVPQFRSASAFTAAQPLPSPSTEASTHYFKAMPTQATIVPRSALSKNKTGATLSAQMVSMMAATVSATKTAIKAARFGHVTSLMSSMTIPTWIGWPKLKQKKQRQKSRANHIGKILNGISQDTRDYLAPLSLLRCALYYRKLLIATALASFSLSLAVSAYIHNPQALNLSAFTLAQQQQQALIETASTTSKDAIAPINSTSLDFATSAFHNENINKLRASDLPPLDTPIVDKGVMPISLPPVKPQIGA